MRRARSERSDANDADVLRQLGYSEQLFRHVGGFSSFALSFSIISILTGGVLLYGYGLRFVGPVASSVAWPLVSLMTLFVAASMAELCSAYPTAGGLYFWAFRLGGPAWAYFAAWLNMLGQVTITAAINIASAIYLIGASTRLLHLASDQPIPLFGTVTAWNFRIFVMVLLLVPQVLLNLRGSRLAARLSDVSAYVHLACVAAVVLALVFLARYHNPLSFLVSTSTVESPLSAASVGSARGAAPGIQVGSAWLSSPLFALFPSLQSVYARAPFCLVFVLSLLQAQWTYTGYDASAHIAEETVSARVNAARGLFLSVWISAIAGYVFLLALTWCIPRGDVRTTALDAYPVLYILYENLPSALADLVAWTLGLAMWLCGTTSITSMARMWYAFARDDGLPGSRLLKRVDPKTGTPVAATIVTSALTVLLCLYAAAYSILTSVSTIALYLAYAIPIGLHLRNHLRGHGEHAGRVKPPWGLGRFSPYVNAVALLWVLFITVVFCLPPNELVLWTMSLVLVVLAFHYGFFGRRTFRGPIPADERALRAQLGA